MHEVWKYKKLITMGLAAVIGASACAGGDTSNPTKPKAFVDGCKTFGIYAQNRWTPIGTSVREEPNVLSMKIEPGFAGNEVIAVDGWVHAKAPYPDNSSPWDSDVWFHLANREGWIGFAAVRGAATEPDPTLRAEGGKLAPTPPECEATYKQ